MAGEEEEEKKKKTKAMWLYPKAVGLSPSERWGHSACFLDGVVYVFGGCCGGSHFGEVLALELNTMTWSRLPTTGDAPGTRDSHTAAVVGQRMLVFGGTNGSRKVNDVHELDLRTREWRRPLCVGEPPCARESHTATVVAGERVVVFGGSGGGGGRARYLNDVHVLDVGRMAWTAAETKGVAPPARDSHTAVAVGNRLVVYGGDCGDRYHGDVDILDIDTMTWSQLAVQGPSPGVRAGHAAVSIGNKVYIIGGVGDKHYYGDVWVLDLNSCSWSMLDTAGRRPQGRFSHTAVVTNNDIFIYGGCGEDERPLNELLVLQLGSSHPNGRYNVSMCKIFGSHCRQKKPVRDSKPVPVKRRATDRVGDGESLICKRKQSGDGMLTETDSEVEEHSLSLSQGSSPSHSDQDHQTTLNIRVVPKAATALEMLQIQQTLMGAEVHGTVDGAFDSGYLMTASVNGQMFRGVLFAPGPAAMVVPRPMSQQTAISMPPPQVAATPFLPRPSHRNASQIPRQSTRLAFSPPSSLQSSKLGNDLHGVVLTLGNPGGCN